MLNYIWAGLIISSLAFALWVDVGEMRRDPYRTGRPVPVTIHFLPDEDPDAEKAAVEVEIDPLLFGSHFGVAAPAAIRLPATLLRTDAGDQLRFAQTPLPEPLSTMSGLQNDQKELRGGVRELMVHERIATGQIVFDTVRFTKLKAIQDGAVESAKTAVTLAIGLIGILALWLGLMKIAEASGLVDVMVKLVQPLLHPLFPQIPRGHPAMGMIALNLAANMLGLGNAATPLGIKAMEELQKLNPTDDTATDPMVMLLAMNTASVQLVPPATLVALMGVAAGEVFFPMLVVTFLSLIIAIVATKLLGRMRMYRKTNPNLTAANTPA